MVPCSEDDGSELFAVHVCAEHVDDGAGYGCSESVCSQAAQLFGLQDLVAFVCCSAQDTGVRHGQAGIVDDTAILFRDGDVQPCSVDLDLGADLRVAGHT